MIARYIRNTFNIQGFPAFSKLLPYEMQDHPLGKEIEARAHLVGSAGTFHHRE
jgi:hypothetical protein